MANTILLRRYIKFIALVTLLAAAPHAVSAQQPQPITAVGTIADKMPLTMTFPATGGAVTGSVLFYEEITHDYTCHETVTMNLKGNFSGGDGGEVSGTLTYDLAGDCAWTTAPATGTWSGHLHADGTGSGTLMVDYAQWGTVQRENWKITFSSQEFQAALMPPVTPAEEGTPTGEPTGGRSCSPQAWGLSPSKPGDAISPGAGYFDAKGQQVGVIQQRWFLNGINTNSIIWDGKEVKVELQWTCLDHMGYSLSFSIPAYQGQPAIPPAAPQPPESAPPNTPGGTSPAGIAVGVGAIIIGALGAAGVSGIAISQVIKPAPKAPAPPGRTPTPPTGPTPLNQVAPPAQPPAPPEPGKATQLLKNRLTPEEQARLINRRGEMESEINRLKNEWRQKRDDADKLNRLKKKNMLKFIMKKGIETQNWIINSPPELINKVTVDPLMDKLFEKHDTTQDGNIIVKINNSVQRLKAEMQQKVEEVKHLRVEIAKTDQNLAGAGQ